MYPRRCWGRVDFSCPVLQTVSPGEKCWGKCIPSSPALVTLLRALFCSVGAEQATSATQRRIITLSNGLREDFRKCACKPFSLVEKLHRGWVWSSLPFQLAAKVPQEGEKTQTLAGWSTTEWVMEMWRGVQCADLQMVLWLESLRRGNTTQHPDDAPHSQARLTGGRERNGCQISPKHNTLRGWTCPKMQIMRP